MMELRISTVVDLIHGSRIWFVRVDKYGTDTAFICNVNRGTYIGGSNIEWYWIR